MIKLNLEKSTAALKLSLEKKGIVDPPTIDVAIAMDVSGSFEDEHEAGVTNDLMQRLAPWGLAFDPDKKLDVFTFSDGPRHAHYVGALTANNYQNFVRQQIIDKVPGWCSGTDYSHVLEKIFQSFGWGAGGDGSGKPGFFKRLFGGQSDAAPASTAGKAQRKRSVVFLITDGENSDQSRTRSVLNKAQREGYEVYIMFLGISNQPGEFAFIESLGDEFDNTGFLPIKNLKAFVNQDDEALNEALLVPELLTWLKS